MRVLAAHKRVEELRRENEKLERLCRLTAEIARLSSERSTLQKIVDTAASLLGVEGAHLALVDREERDLYGVVSSGRHHEGAPRLRVQLSQSAAAQKALTTRRCVSIGNAEHDARVNPRIRKMMSIRGVAYLPLLSGQESFGLLILNTRRPRVWSRSDLGLAKRFADIASVALENARLMTTLAETEARFRSLVEHIPAIVYRCDLDPPFRTRYISPQARSMLGFPPEEWLQDPAGFITKIIHPEDLSALIDLSNEGLRRKGFVTAEYRLLDKSGEIRWFRDEAVLVRDPSGTPVAWHGVLVEITGMKKIHH